MVSDYSKKIPIWWEMKNSYKEDMDTFINMIEDEDDIKDIKDNKDIKVIKVIKVERDLISRKSILPDLDRSRSIF